MSFLSKIFKPKPGGTFMGNLFRKVTNAATGGIIGSGAGLANRDQKDLYNLDDAAYLKKYGKTKIEGANLAGVPLNTLSPQNFTDSGELLKAQLGGLLTNGAAGVIDVNNQANQGNVSSGFFGGAMSAQNMKLLRIGAMILGGLLLAFIGFKLFKNKK